MLFSLQAISFKANQCAKTTTLHLALFFLSSQSFDMDASSLFLPALVLLSYQKIIFGWREWGRGPRVPIAGTAGSAQVGAAGWCQRFKYSHRTDLGWAKNYSGRRRGGEVSDVTGSCHLGKPFIGAQYLWVCNVSSSSWASLYFSKCAIVPYLDCLHIKPYMFFQWCSVRNLLCKLSDAHRSTNVNSFISPNQNY